MNQEVPQTKKESSIKDFIVFTALTIIFVLPIRLFIAQPFIVNGESMLPTFQNGEYLIVDELTYRLREPERGEVVIFRYPNDPSKFFIKRIIGLPNETVQIEQGHVKIISPDGNLVSELEEPYITLSKNTNAYSILDNDEYFVMGDNRASSLDSRVWGPLPEDHLVGRAFLRLLPINSIDFLPGNIKFKNE